MITVQLNRTTKQGKKVSGKMIVPLSIVPVDREDQNIDLTFDTIENADFIIPAGTYPLRMTWSPKFKKLLPLIDEDLPDRDGIRIHRGTIPEHSTGCVLTNARGMNAIDVLFTRISKFYKDEKVRITITDDFGAAGGNGL